VARIVLKAGGARELRRHPKIEADLLARAKRIAAAAGDGHEASSQVGVNRARASVITVSFPAMVREARDRTLTRSIDAGR